MEETSEASRVIIAVMGFVAAGFAAYFANKAISRNGGDGFLPAAIVFTLVFVVFLSMIPKKSRTSYETPAEQLEFSHSDLETNTPVISAETKDSNNTVTFTRVSNGHDWQRADSQSKQRFCKTIAAAMTKEFKRDFTPTFYSEALDAFYDTTDPNILNQNIHQVIGLVTASAMSK